MLNSETVAFQLDSGYFPDPSSLRGGSGNETTLKLKQPKLNQPGFLQCTIVYVDPATKADRLSTISAFPTREKPSCASVTLPPESSTTETHFYARFMNAHTVQILNNL